MNGDNQFKEDLYCFPPETFNLRFVISRFGWKLLSWFGVMMQTQGWIFLSSHLWCSSWHRFTLYPINFIVCLHSCRVEDTIVASLSCWLSVSFPISYVDWNHLKHFRISIILWKWMHVLVIFCNLLVIYYNFCQVTES
jgi:hypothetical protein